MGATHPAGEVTCEIRHGSAYETRRNGGAIHVAILQPRVSTRNAKLERLLADEGLGPYLVLTDPTSLSFWGRGIGGDYEFSIPDHEFDAGLDLTGSPRSRQHHQYSIILQQINYLTRVKLLYQRVDNLHCLNK